MQNISMKLWEPARVLREEEEPIPYFVHTKNGVNSRYLQIIQSNMLYIYILFCLS